MTRAEKMQAGRLPGAPYRIDGETIVLREVRVEDADGPYTEWMNDDEIVCFTESRHTSHSRDAIAAYIAARAESPDDLFLAITARNDGAHIGNIKIGPIDWRNRIGDLGLIVGNRRYWGRGIATEAIALITQYAFETVGLHKVTAGCYTPNRAAIRAFEKAGYSQEGVLRAHWLLDGLWTDIVMLGILNPAENRNGA
jgi:RimJ/RimL family protein N-acetyltransferase